MEILTKTENKVAHAISKGLIEKEIADKFFVSTHTIHAHARNIRKKLKARNMVDVARIYILSLDKPKDVLKALLFLALHLTIVFTTPDVDLRKTKHRVSRCKTVRRSKTNTTYYV